MNHINTLKHIETSSLEEYSDDNGISEQPLTASKNPQDREKIERENLKEENKRKKIRDIRKIKEKGKHSETKDVLQD